jgi:hypothetical protein
MVIRDNRHKNGGRHPGIRRVRVSLCRTCFRYAGLTCLCDTRYMNLVLDDAEEVSVKKGTRRKLGALLRTRLRLFTARTRPDCFYRYRNRRSNSSEGRQYHTDDANGQVELAIVNCE